MRYQTIDVSSEHPLIVSAQRELVRQTLTRGGVAIGGTLLDIGPGKGVFTKFFLELGFRVTCVDVDRTLENEFAKMGSVLLTSDLRDTRLPLEDGSMNVIWCSHVIEHVPDSHKFLGECHRVLAEGGSIVIRTPDLKRVKFDFWHDPTHVHPFIKVSLQKALALADFTPVLLSNCDMPNIRGLHRIRAYKWLPKILWSGDNIIAVGVKRGKV